MGAAVGSAFVEVCMAVSGSDAGGGAGGAVGLSGEVGGADCGSDDGVGVGAAGLLVRFGGVGLLVEVRAVIGGVDWAACAWESDGSPVVCGCWLHPHSDKPTRALAAAICIFRIDFILASPFFKPPLASVSPGLR
jgi:hypothetical protein